MHFPAVSIQLCKFIGCGFQGFRVDHVLLQVNNLIAAHIHGHVGPPKYKPLVLVYFLNLKAPLFLNRLRPALNNVTESLHFLLLLGMKKAPGFFQTLCVKWHFCTLLLIFCTFSAFLSRFTLKNVRF